MKNLSRVRQVFALSSLSILLVSCSDSETTKSVRERAISPSKISLTLQDLPQGWTFDGNSDGFDDASPIDGPCGGPNLQQVALGASAKGMRVQFLQSPELPNAFLQIGIVTFLSESDANKFLDGMVRVASDCSNYDEEVSEAVVDGFLDGYGEDAMWRIISNMSVGKGYSTLADASALITRSEFYTTEYERNRYSEKIDKSWDFSVFGTVVVWSRIYQEHSDSGFSNSDAGPEQVVFKADELVRLVPLVELVAERIAAS